jgi:hypothetical protein
MTGSTLAPIIIPIAALIGLAAWLIMVFHAASHPFWRSQSPAPEQPGTGTAARAAQRPDAPRPQTRPAEPAGNLPAPGPGHTSGPEIPRAA